MNFLRNFQQIGLFILAIFVSQVFPVSRGRIKQVHRPKVPQPTGKKYSINQLKFKVCEIFSYVPTVIQ